MIEASPKRLAHVGIMVKDVDKCVDYYENVLGIGPFRPPRELSFAHNYKDGKQEPFKVRIAQANIGGTRLDLIQVLEGPLGESFREVHGEGIQHIGFEVDDFDAEVERLKQAGVGMELVAGDGSYVHLATDHVGGASLELNPKPKPRT